MMNVLLWVLQVLAAPLFAASGIMKVFMFDKVSQDVPSFGALPRKAWLALGILELVCTVGPIVPSALNWQPVLTVVAATVLACETLVFIWVHVKYRELPPIIFCCVLGTTSTSRGSTRCRGGIPGRIWRLQPRRLRRRVRPRRI
jgi:uncharacterized membrane protein YphA (DoxX/SURF4 family)